MKSAKVELVEQREQLRHTYDELSKAREKLIAVEDKRHAELLGEILSIRTSIGLKPELQRLYDETRVYPPGFSKLEPGAIHRTDTSEDATRLGYAQSP